MTKKAKAAIVAAVLGIATSLGAGIASSERVRAVEVRLEERERSLEQRLHSIDRQLEAHGFKLDRLIERGR